MSHGAVSCRSCGETYDHDTLQRTPAVIARTLFCPACGRQLSQTPPPAPHQKHGLRK